MDEERLRIRRELVQQARQRRKICINNFFLYVYNF